MATDAIRRGQAGGLASGLARKRELRDQEIRGRYQEIQRYSSVFPSYERRCAALIKKMVSEYGLSERQVRRIVSPKPSQPVQAGPDRKLSAPAISYPPDEDVRDRVDQFDQAHCDFLWAVKEFRVPSPRVADREEVIDIVLTFADELMDRFDWLRARLMKLGVLSEEEHSTEE